MKQKKYLASLMALVIVTSSCVDLEHINSFSKTSVHTIAAYKDAGYSYTYSYFHFTQTSGIYNAGNASPKKVTTPSLVFLDNEPKTAMAADAVINVFMTGISAYFSGISKISDQDLVNFNFDDIGKNLRADKTLKAKLNLTDDKNGDEKIAALTKISGIFTTEMAGAYRRKRVKEIMIKYDGALALSIDALTEMLDNCLLRALVSDAGLIDSKYSILADPDLEYSKKIDLMRECLNEKLQLEKSRQQIVKISEGLKKMKEGHHAVAEKLKTATITSKEAIVFVRKYAAEVYEISNTIKSIQ
ncbi:MAG: hypothetical protein V4635_09120 [Bacteroidota bacterium]